MFNMQTIKKYLGIIRNFVAIILIGSVVIVVAFLVIGDVIISRYEDFHGSVNRVELISRIFHWHDSKKIISRSLTKRQWENLHKSKQDYMRCYNAKDIGKIFDFIPPFKINYLIKTEKDYRTESELRQSMIDSLDTTNFGVTTYDSKRIYQSYFKGDTIFNFSLDSMTVITESDTGNYTQLMVNVSYNSGKSWYFFYSGFPDVQELSETKKSIRKEFSPELADSLFSELTGLYF